MPIHLQKTISCESEAQVYMDALCVLVREHLSGLSSLNLAGGEDLILRSTMVADLIKVERCTSGYIKPEMTYNMDACPKYSYTFPLIITGSSI